MKKIVTILLFALTVFAGCSKDEKPTPAPTMPVNGVIYLHSESVLEERACSQGGDARRDGCRTNIDLYLRGLDK